MARALGLYSGDLRQGFSNNSVINFVLGFPYVFQRETQPSFELIIGGISDSQTNLRDQILIKSIRFQFRDSKTVFSVSI